MDGTDPGSDLALLRAARDGDRQALDTLVARYEPRVYRFGLGLCRNVEDARDILQDTFIAMVRSLSTFRADASVSTWLFAIARNACLRKRRRRSAAPRTVESLEALAPADQQTLVAPTASPEAAAANAELRQSLHVAIASLDADQREVLLLRDVEGLPAADVASALGVSVAAVKSRLHRARVAVRQALTPVLEPAAGASGCTRCRDIALMFSRHLEGDLSTATCAEMETHMATCAVCRSACASLKEVLALCRTAPADVPPAERHALRAAVDACLADGSAAGAAPATPAGRPS